MASWKGKLQKFYVPDHCGLEPLSLTKTIIVKLDADLFNQNDVHICLFKLHLSRFLLDVDTSEILKQRMVMIFVVF